MDATLRDAIDARLATTIQRWEDLVTYEIPRMVAELGSIDTDHVATRITRVACLPQDISETQACLDNLNYGLDVVVDIESDNGDYSDVVFCAIPRMLTTGPFAGTFICRGKRRYIPYLESAVHNRPLRVMYKKRHCIEVRSEHLDKPGRATSTIRVLAAEGSFPCEAMISYTKARLPCEDIIAVLDRRIALPVRQAAAARLALKLVKPNETPMDLERIEQLLDTEVVPHQRTNRTEMMQYLVGLSEDFRNGFIGPTDRDELGALTLEDTTTLFRRLFRQNLTEHVRNVKKMLYRTGDVMRAYKDGLTAPLFCAVSTGRWSRDGKIYGISHPLKTENHVILRAQRDRITSPLRHGKGSYIDARAVHESTYGFVCPAQTPDGADCGMVKSLALAACVTPELPCPLDHILEAFPLTWTAPIAVLGPYGVLRGFTDRPQDLLAALRERRFPGVSAYLDRDIKAVVVDSSAGRIVQPLRNVFTGEVTYVDANDLKWQANDYVNFRPLCDSAILGYTAASLVGVRHNFGPRTAFQTSMANQCISPDPPVDPAAPTQYLLHHGQLPLYGSAIHDTLDGVNCVVLLASHGFAVEDGIVIKKEAVERGLFASSTYRTYVASIAKDGAFTSERKVLIPKTVAGEDVSVELQPGDSGVVDHVYSTPTLRKVTTRTHCEFTRGDKLTNRHGQKGVQSLLVPACDLPFDPRTGIIPDIVIGPSCIPTRMTVGMLIEMMVGTAAALNWRRETEPLEWDDAITAANIRRLEDVLHKNGFSRSGKVMMTDGATGEMFEAGMAMGFVHYSKMIQMVNAKAQCRSIGPVQPMLRQPNEGRRNGGGPRFGNMECDVLAAHGAAETLLRKTCADSDEVRVFICATCGCFSREHACGRCGAAGAVRAVRMPCSAVVLFTELRAEGLDARFGLEPDASLQW